MSSNPTYIVRQAETFPTTVQLASKLHAEVGRRRTRVAERRAVPAAPALTRFVLEGRDEERRSEVRRWLGDRAFLELEPIVRTEIQSLIEQLYRSDEGPALLDVVIQSRIMGALALNEKLALVRQAIGPRTAPRPDDQDRPLFVGWRERRTELVAFLAELAAAHPERNRAEIRASVKRFLEERDQRVSLISSEEGDDLVVFGAPEQRALAYGAREAIVLRLAGAELDRRMKADRKRDAIQSLKELALSRIEERLLIEWIETSFAIALPGEQGMPRLRRALRPISPAELVERMEALLDLVAGGAKRAPIRMIVLRGGREWVASKQSEDDARCDALVRRYLER